MTLKNALTAAAGSAADKKYIEDVFSVYSYIGNGTTKTIVNNINLSEDGGAVFIKRLPAYANPIFFDTERGATKFLYTGYSDGQTTTSTSLTAFNSDGFTLGSYSEVNGNTNDHISLTFKKSENFFDIVTYTGNGTTQNIAHNLGSVPGCIMVKRVDAVSNWATYHRSFPSGYQNLNTPNTFQTTGASNVFGDNSSVVSPTSGEFTVGSNSIVNSSGGTYVAYIYAHNAGGFGVSGNDDVISCGSYTGNGNTTSGNTITLGWEPQLIIIKGIDNSDYYVLLNNVRGLGTSYPSAKVDFNYGGAETNNIEYANLLPSGFKVLSQYNASSKNYMYIAIRRSPMRPPETGTDVLDVYLRNGITTTYNNFFDLTITGNGDYTNGFYNQKNYFSSRLSSSSGYWCGSPPYSTAGEPSWGLQAKLWVSNVYTDDQSGYPSDSNKPTYNFTRSKGFFDIVPYTGTSVAQSIEHGLGVVPELIIVHNRNASGQWVIYHASRGNTKGIYFTNAAETTNSGFWNNTSPTSSVFTVGTNTNVNFNAYTYMAWMFATLDGVSKVGSYTGTGASSQQIDCGFSSGARFILTKSATGTGDWYLFDSARGITSGNDPYTLFNASLDSKNTTDYLTPYSAGFEINSSASATINVSGQTYIYLAVS